MSNFREGDLDEDPTRDTKETMDYIQNISKFEVFKESGKDLTTFFPDQKRRIDYVVIHDLEKNEKIVSQVVCRPPLTQDEMKAIRKKYFENLQEAGLQIQKMAIECEDYYIYFTLIHIPWNVLVYYAELMNFKVPFRERDDDKDYTQYHWSYSCFNSLHCKCFNRDVPNDPVNYFTCDFRIDHLENYIGYKNKDTFFKTIDRIKVALEVLEETEYGINKTEKGLSQLIKLNIFSTAYPLHDGPYKYEGDDYKTEDNLNNRQILNYYWAYTKSWFKYQPLDHIRQYNGEKIAFYFAFFGLYISWLIPLSLIGLLVFILGIITVQMSAMTEDVCTVPLSTVITSDFIAENAKKVKASGDDNLVNDTENGNQRNDKEEKKEKGISVMCPLCDVGCEYWNISKACLSYQLAYISDYPGTVFYSFFTSIWSVSMLQAWRRLRIRLAHTWNCHDIVLEEERPRAQYVLKAPQMGINPITGLVEPTYPDGIVSGRLVATGIVFIIMVICVFIFLVAVILYRVLVADELLRINSFTHSAVITVAISGAIFNFILLRILDLFYEYIAYRLTDWEVHRTETEYYNHFSIKIFLFSALNTYSSLFYIAFFKGRFSGYPGNYRSFLGARLESCDNDNCSSELTINVFIYFFGTLLSDTLYKLTLPLFDKCLFRKKREIIKMLKTIDVKPRWLEDYCMTENPKLWLDLLTTMTQLSFVTLFVAAFPLAPLLALLSNIVKIRLEAQKYVLHNQRPFPERVKNLGIWSEIFKIIIGISIFVNGCIIALTLDFLPKMVYMIDKGEWDLHGYLAFSMAYSVEMKCRYHGYRDLEGNFTKFFWKLLFVRALFVILFEVNVVFTFVRKKNQIDSQKELIKLQHFIIVIAKVVQLLFPKIPKDVDIQIKRERYLAKQTFKPSDVYIRVKRDRDLAMKTLSQSDQK